MLSKLMMNKSFLVGELFVLSMLVPGGIFLFKLAPYILLFLWFIFVYTLFVYWCLGSDKSYAGTFNFKTLFLVLGRWAFASVILLFMTHQLFPQKLFMIQANNPGLIWKILLFYPLFSALPQEFIFCKFFFRRYRCLFGDGTLMVTMSAVAFCLAHILFLNWVAPVLGFLAGIIFANTYRRTHSLAMVTLEHSLYGNAIFVMGLGWFFWGGSIN